MDNITINGKDFKVKYTIRALFAFEQITGKTFELKTVLDNYLFLYCILLANNEEVCTWDEFLTALDEDPNLYVQLNDIITKAQSKESVFEQPTDNGEKKS